MGADRDVVTTEIAGDACPRCGSVGYTLHHLPDPRCWDGRLDETLAWQISEAARMGERQALSLVARSFDRRAAPAWRQLLESDEPRVVAAAVTGLGFCGDDSDLPRLRALVSPGDKYGLSRWRPVAVIDAITCIGGSQARDALWENLDGLGEASHRDRAVACLAWLGDPRIKPELLARVPEWPHWDHFTFTHALARAVGTVDAGAALTAQLIASAPASIEPRAYGAFGYRFTEVSMLLDVPARERLIDDLLAVSPALGFLRPTQPTSYGEPETDLLLRRRALPQVPTRVMELVPLEADAADQPEDPLPRFGGQPTWRAAPTWPVSEHGYPFAFFGQLPGPPGSGRTVYLFADAAGDAEWDENLVAFAQPGPPPSEPTLPLSTGPSLFLRPNRESYGMTSSTAERWITPNLITPWVRQVRFVEASTPEWSAEMPTYVELDEDWRRAGGSPLYLQGDGEGPEGDGWTFAFQFGAAWAGQELGDGAQVYAFVHDDGRVHSFWQCH